MSESEKWTIGRLLTWTTDYLKQHGADSPRLDAELLLAHALQCERIELYTAFGDECDDTARAAFRELVRQRATGVPVAYLVGTREFYSLSFEVTPDVLIPRPDTELMVVTVLDLVKQNPVQEGPAILDMGTGSGCLAITLAKQLPAARLTAVDLSPAALKVARRNADRHGVTERITWIESDLFANLDPQEKFDYIVCNPPYIAHWEKEQMARDVYAHEPDGALFAGPEGTEVIARLLTDAPAHLHSAHLHSGGQMLIEISPTIHDAVRQMAEADPRWHLFETHYDLGRRPRIVRVALR